MRLRQISKCQPPEGICEMRNAVMALRWCSGLERKKVESCACGLWLRLMKEWKLSRTGEAPVSSRQTPAPVIGRSSLNRRALTISALLPSNAKCSNSWYRDLQYLALHAVQVSICALSRFIMQSISSQTSLERFLPQ
jgi:hypothetical protein